MECAECGVRAPRSGQSCARCGAPLRGPVAAPISRPAAGGRLARAVRMVWRRVPIAPGFYPDPGGKAAIREWTGSEWSPFLQGYPARHGPAAGSGPPPTWSPLPPDVQQAEWSRAISAPGEALSVIIALLAYGVMMAVVAVLAAFTDRDPQAPVVIGLSALAAAGCLIPAGVAIRNWPAVRRIAAAAKEALALASVQDQPPPPESM